MAERILVVDDESGAREGLRRLLVAWGYDAETAASVPQAFSRIEDDPPDAIITDLVMPGIDGLEFVRRLQASFAAIPVIVFSGQGTIEAAVEAVKLGAVDFLEKPVEPPKLKILLEKLAGRREILSENRRLRAELKEHGAFGRLRGSSEGMRSVFRQIEQVAPSTLSVLVVGESGTGKELVAQTVHELSPRRRNEFVALNCAAIPATLLESEIFGHERGAFTGAVQRKIGCFEMAHRGTLFLDEISEMDELLQAKLLRVLQEQRFRRVGGRDLIEADVRVIAATNRDPAKAILDGKLREDLYYRLNVFTIVLPPLRERPDDIGALARNFLKEYCERQGGPVSKLDDETLDILLRHAWPGNVRELKNAMERAALLAAGGAVRPEHLPPEIRRTAPKSQPSPAAPASPLGAPAESGDPPSAVRIEIGVSMEEAEREIIASTLRHTGGNKTRAAKILGISLKTMHNKVKKFAL